MVIHVTDAIVILSWMLPKMSNGIITQYQMEYRSGNSSDFISLNITNSILTYTVTGLTSNTDYVFRVRAFTVVGHGPPSNEVTHYTSKLKYV